MYGLLQARVILRTALWEKLLQFGYAPAPITPFLLMRDTNGITLKFVVGDFGIKYQRKEDTQHLINVPQENMR